ncbi:cdgsh iron-sulfur domain-containing protein neet [Quercus suber]|uniref:Cdgsh iron-sulfur domain-containing protein neet n=1 Tax=Quercus suber TaxID=58331 RepID=A0AAW0LBM4_QUESU
MASILSTVGATLSYNKPPMEGLKQSTRGGTHFKSLSFGGVSVKPRRVAVAVRAESQGINPEIRKSEDKVVDSVVVTELSKPLTAYCR